MKTLRFAYHPVHTKRYKSPRSYGVWTQSAYLPSAASAPQVLTDISPTTGLEFDLRFAVEW